jgi:UDP-glucose 4-epimerase
MIELKHEKYLVTGGAGFIGSHICEEIVRQGKEVIVVDNLVAGKMKNLEDWWDPKLCTFVKTSIGNFENIRGFFEGVDIVFHNAASKCTVCRDNPLLDLLVNAWGSFNVFEAARVAGVKKVIHASTGSVNNCKPVSFYGVSKLAGESYLNAFNDYYPEFNYTVLRYHHVYGPRQESSDVGGVIPIFIRNVYNDEPTVVFGSGSQVRHFTSVKDVVAANFFVANNSSADRRVFNVLSGVCISIKDLAYKIHEVMDREPNVVFGPRKLGDIDLFTATSNELITLGFDFQDNFEVYLRETVDWYLEYFNET